MLLTITDIAVSFGNASVLNHITFTLNPGERVGLVGANGVGKSTLLKVIDGQLPPDAGTVQIMRGVDVGYLPQEVHALPGQTVQGLLDEAMANLHAMSARMRQLESDMANPDADLDAVFAEYDTLTEAFELQGGYDMETRVAQVLAGLQIEHIERNRTVESLSGGERSRVALAAMLARSPGLLLLDEPTNHIDAATIEWVEDYLSAYRGGVLVVSHDRAFLNRTVTRIIEIDEHTRDATSYPGSYSAYAEEKARRMARWREDYATQQEEIKTLRAIIKGKSQPTGNRHIKTTDNDRFIKHFKGETADRTHARDLNAAEERLRRIEADAIPRPPRPLIINPDLDPAALRGQFPVTLAGVRKSYGERVILDDVSLTLGPTDRIAITGPNGAGKSTLLKIIAGVLRPDAGTVTLGPSVRLGYLPQIDALAGPMTLMEAYRDGQDGTYETHKAALISSGFFTYDQFDTPLSGLSAGQRRKLQLARLIAAGANVLLLDEPTNHLSLDVLEGFETALREFAGAVIAVSHDRHFLERFGGQVLALDGGKVGEAGDSLLSAHIASVYYK